MPVVAETYDGSLNDINGFHLKPEHVFAALDQAASGPIQEGNVGGGTGMSCHRFKGGIGTASRKVEIEQRLYTVGVLVQANYGAREDLTIAGAPVGREIPDLLPQLQFGQGQAKDGSIIVVVASDAPLFPHQLTRLAKRAPLGLARVGGMGFNSSGDIFIAFSTANSGAARRTGIRQLEMLPNDRLDSVIRATIEATEEAIINALIAAETMEGINGNTVYALPHDRLQAVLRKYNRV
jgi:L-aminopeptidase/D-esterase-like protein